MNIRTILIVVLLVVLGALGLLLLLTGRSAGAPPPSASPNFTILDLNRTGGYGYALLAWNGTGSIRLLAFNESPKRSVYILRDPDGISSTHFDAFVDEFTVLKRYGYNVSVVSTLADLQDGIYIVPTGAMPAFVLNGLSYPHRTTIYLGRKDLLIQGGVHTQEWYSELDTESRSRLVIYETTLDALYETNATALPQAILQQQWALAQQRTFPLNVSGTGTFLLPLQEASYLRLIYERPNALVVYDSSELQVKIPINASPSSVFPWEKSEVQVQINRTNGSAFFYASRNGESVYAQPIGRVSEPNLFFFRLQFSEPGDYLLHVQDSESEVAGGWLHVQDLRIRPAGARGERYLFNITVDGDPFNGPATVRLNYSNQSANFLVRDGELAVPARLRKGLNPFVITLASQDHMVLVENQKESILDVYLRWGLPGLVLIVLVYGFARLARRPIYRIRFGDIGKEIRKDVHITVSDALQLFPRVRRTLGVDGPITSREFSIGLKRYLTEGADVTDGNVEALLKKLDDLDRVEAFRGYYQLKGEGDVQRNTLRRLVREALIEQGISFEIKEGRYVTRDFEIGFLGDRFTKKAYVVLESPEEKARLYAALPASRRALFEIQELNGKIEFITPEMLKQIL